MSHWLLLPAALFAIALLVAAVVSSCTSRIVRHAAQFEPGARASLLWYVTLSPWIVAAGFACMGFLPTLLFDLGLVRDLCLDRQALVRLACPMHPQTVWINGGGWMLVALAAAMAAAAGAYVAAQMSRALRTVRFLEGSSDAGSDPDIRIVRSANAIALSATWPRPRIYVSEAVLAALEPGEVAALLEHERAHVRRHDNTRVLIARLAAFALTPHARRELLRALELAVEQACDQAAAAKAGAVTVASALVKFSRAATDLERPAAPLMSTYGGADIERRVKSLLSKRALRGAPLWGRLRLKAAIMLVPACWLLHEFGEFLLLPLVQ